MKELAFHVSACAAWTPKLQSWADWCGWANRSWAAGVDESVAPPMMLRRRVGMIGQRALKAAWGVSKLRDARYVFASRHGEFERTVTMMRAIAAGDGPSPAEFSLSVHNALAGLLSIAAANRAGHTTITAGPETFCAALLEAVAGLAEDPATPAVLVFYDMPLIEPYDELMRDQPDYAEPLAVVLEIGSARGEHWNIGLSMTRRQADLLVDARPALAFLAFLLAGDGEVEVQGTRHGWRWRHV